MTGILLVNLGTPQAPTPKAVRRYLREFLWDPRVVEIPRPLWWCLLNGLVLPLRGWKSAKLYQSIWQEAGSPLLNYSQSLTQALKGAYSQERVHCELAMRYGSPSIRAGLEALKAKGMKRLLILPLYPQYSATTTASVFDEVAAVLQTWRHVPSTTWVDQYASEPAYIDAIAQSILHHWKTQQRGDKLLFSFHGLPQRFVDLGDPYEQQCQNTAHLVANVLDLKESEWQLTFQSRFGKAKWLTPYTDITLQALATAGVKKIDVICPGFAVDCLETLEEIKIRNREGFLAAGGEAFHYIPCLNDNPSHVNAIKTVINRHLPR